MTTKSCAIATTYMGIPLAHPFMAGASPMSASLDTVKRLEDAGCSAIVMHSLFEEQITAAMSGTIHHMDPLDEQFATKLAIYPKATEYRLPPEDYLEHLRRVKAAVHMPVIASLNGTSAESWLKYACLMEEAGADGLEINLYEVITDPDIPGTYVETLLRDLVSGLKAAVKIPVAVKLTPFFAAFANVAQQLDRAGADGLVLFNRFYQPDIDIQHMTAVPALDLSKNDELRLRLRWLAILHGKVRASLALTGGVETPADGIKGLLAGAHVVQLVSTVLRNGPACFSNMRNGLEQWMDWQKISSVGEMRGRVSAASVADPTAFERASYIRALNSWGT
jgi:dihydroorotate dehydrogenase (fumarate)